MISNYLKYVARSLAKNKTYSLLNIMGLSAGLTCFALIALWVNDELSYDKFNTNYGRIVRLTGVAKTETGTVESAVSAAPMAKALKEDYAEVENTVRVDIHEEIVQYKNQQILQPGILLADPSILDVFSYTLSRGNAATALNEPYSIVLTQSTAKKYFGEADPMGQTLVIFLMDSAGSGAAYKVTGIMPDPPQNAHFTFNILASFKTAEVAHPDILTTDGWGDTGYYTYLLLKKGVDREAFSKKITQFYGKYIGDLFNVWRNIYSYQLQPLSDIHLRSHLQYEIAANGDITQVYIFLTIGIFILLLAGINYTNLATARSAARAKEIGIKKVAGAGRGQLIAQFLLESVSVACIALLLACVFAFLLQPVFYRITGKELSILANPTLILFLLGVTVSLGLLSGLYPAFILSSFKPVGILKGAFKTGNRGVALRKTLVVAQFAVTIILITGIVIIYSQMSFIKHRDLGYNKDVLLFVNVNGNADVIRGYNAFKQELASSSLIGGMATSNSMIVGGLSSGGAETVDAAGNPLQVNTARLRVDADYLSVYSIQLLAGGNFSPTAAQDTIRQVVLNETAVKKFGWKNNEAAIGQPFSIGGRKGVVIGVVRNFHFSPLQKAIIPLAIYPLTGHFSRITLKVDIDKTSRVLALVGNTWKKHFPAALFDYDFVNHNIKEQYQAEERFSTIFLYFSILSVLIACLGLYGLIAFTIFQKTKEIGVRKVLGATVHGIAAMLSGSFLKWVLLACFIAMPIAWYVMNKWLQQFAYRIDVSWWMFTVAGIMVLLIALATVSIQAIKAALANPVKSLRTE